MTTAAFRSLLSATAISLIFCSSMVSQPSPKASNIVYEVFVQSFCDSNNDGIGDLPGLISKLDYIKDLGATAIWMMPIHPSPSYHKYDVTDYYGIHPDYGNMDDMKRLISEAHQRGLKVILDLVVNHSSVKHPWFNAASKGNASLYRHYYVWRNFDEVKDEIEKKSTTFDSDNITQWHEVKGEDQRYYGFFSSHMPDFNFDHQPLRDEIYKIGKYWLDLGIDGFRLDAAKHIYPDDQLDKTRQFWEEFRSEMQMVKRNVIIIGEVWAKPEMLVTLFKGLPSLFNFELTELIPQSINSHDPHAFISRYTSMRKTYESAGVPYDDAILLSNHDMNRIRSTFDGDVDKSKLAACILLTLPGTPYIYYGEEIGMLGVKPDPHLREVFPWDDNTLRQKQWQASVHSVQPNVLPLSQQTDDPNSMYHHYKQWIGWRKQFPALLSGDIEFIKHEYPNVLAYMRFTEKQRIMVIHNLGEHAVAIRLVDEFKSMYPAQEKNANGEMVIPARKSVMLYLQ